MLLLNTITGILRNASMNEAAAKIQIQVNLLLKDLERLNDRVGKLMTHFNLAQKDLDEIETSENKIHKRGVKIHSLDLEELPVKMEELKKIQKS